jgi:hypothetical protein
MTQEKEAFLERWSRRKREQPQEQPQVPPAPAESKAEAPAPVLPPVDELKPESDFTPFMNAKVDPATRRSALKKLFADAHYNVPDPFEAYSEDYTKSDPIPEAMLKAINRVRDVAVKGEEKVVEEERLAEEAQASAEKTESVPIEKPIQEQTDVPGKQDA